MLLAIVVAVVISWLDTKRNRRTVTAFCQDLVGSVCDLIQNLEDNRARHNLIEHEFLETISAEIAVYARNREHIVLVHDHQLRKDVRSFFTRVAALLVQVQWGLRQYYELSQGAKTAQSASQQTEMINLATARLNEAQTACDRLRELKTSGEKLLQRLTDLA